jgi:alginate O-acetyltransferase complex protein AlgI
MVFSSPIFLFAFLPLTVIIYYLMGKRHTLRNYWLLLCSLLFYAWGEPLYISVMIGTIFLAYVGALGCEPKVSGEHVASATPAKCDGANAPVAKAEPRKLPMAIFCVLSLGILCYFKYTNLLITTSNELFHTSWNTLKIIMPIGISFYIFQSLSYVVDVYRGVVPAQRNFFKLALYVSFFPQLIAGPIVKYHDVARYIDHRFENWDWIIYGTKRFIQGLAKKMLLANVMGKVADDIFTAGPASIDAPTAWLGALAYTFQIFFDFSGYSDMAIGLGCVFGFKFLENFNYPYISASITEFWHRWHISLSTWFKEYLYIPLGGNRHGQLMTYRNLLIVFACTGIWHGANWTFLFWGLWHGCFLLIEKSSWYKKLPSCKALAHLYALLVVVVGWVFFRSESIASAFSYLQVMFGLAAAHTVTFPLMYYAENKTIIAFIACCFFSIPWHFFSGAKASVQVSNKIGVPCKLVQNLIYLALFFLCCMYVAGATYNPFIYFRF